MHILIVAPEQIPVPPIRGGSVEICIYAIARKLARQHRVTIISRRHPLYKRVTQEGNITIIRVAGGTSAAYLAGVLRTIKRKHYDLIQVDNRPRYASAIKRAMPSTPVSLFLHSLTFVSPAYSSTGTTNSHLAYADLIIANSISLKNKLKSLFPQQANKLRVVQLGVDITRFRPPDAAKARAIRSKYGFNKGFNVLYTGRLIPKKGIDVLIKAVHQARKTIPAIRLIVAGGQQRPGYKAKLVRLVKRLKVPTSFVGYMPHTKLHKIYWLGDCFVCPSQQHEAFGLVNVEAMSSGLPVIASRNGGIKEIVKDGHNGKLVSQYRSPKAFAKHIVELAANRNLASRLGQQARQDAVVHFGWARTADALADLYHAKLNK